MNDQPPRFGPQPAPAPEAAEPALRPDQRDAKCEHISFRGKKCNSPAMRNKHFCYHHQRVRYIRPETALPIPDDPEALVYSAQNIIQAVVDEKLDYKPAMAIAALMRIQHGALQKCMGVSYDHVLEDPNEERYQERLGAIADNAPASETLALLTERVKFG